jgi:hypothetical protein
MLPVRSGKHFALPFHTILCHLHSPKPTREHTQRNRSMSFPEEAWHAGVGFRRTLACIGCSGCTCISSDLTVAIPLRMVSFGASDAVEGASIIAAESCDEHAASEHGVGVVF